MNEKELLKLVLQQRKDAWNQFDYSKKQPKYYPLMIKKLCDNNMEKEANNICRYSFGRYKKGRRFAYDFLVKIENRLKKEINTSQKSTTPKKDGHNSR